MRKLTMIVLVVFFLQNCSTSEKIVFDKSAETKLVAESIDAGIGWVKTKNLDLLYSVISQDSTYLCVNPSDKVVYGFEQFKEAVPFWMSDNFEYVRHDIKELNITFSKSGDVAWFYCKLYDINTWKGQPASWENARWTGVLEKLEGKWVIRQQHFSFAQQNK